MRPLELSVRNFRSYHGDEAVFDFRGRSLVGVVGPIGSGKSSLLDAVAFALYGRTPAGGSATKALIHQRSADGGVQLRFEVDGEIWEVVRSLRRKGQSQHALYRFDDDHPDSAPVDKFVTEGEVNDRIKQLLGLDFDAFGRSVLLAQGRFAEFLTAGATQRDTVLKGVFGHDRIDAMRQAAKAESAERATELATITGQVEQLDSVKTRLVEIRLRLAVVESRLELLRKTEPHLADLDDRLAAATKTRDRAAAEIDELEPHGASLPDEEATTRLLAEAGAVEERRRTVAAELEAAKEAQTIAERDLGKLRTAGESATIDEAADLLTGLGMLHRAHKEATTRLEERRRRLEAHAVEERRLTAEHSAAVVAAAAAVRALDEADAVLAEARERLHRIQHQDMAATLRRDLAGGDDCPVCLRRIDELPGDVVEADLDAGQQAVADAAGRRSAAEQTRTGTAVQVATMEKGRRAAEEARTTLEAEVVEIGERLAEIDGEIADSAARLTALLGPGDPATIIGQRREHLRVAEETAAETRRTVERLHGSQSQVIRDEQEVEKRVVALHRQVIQSATRLGIEAMVHDGDHGSLAAAVAALRIRWKERIEEARSVRASGDAEIAALGAERRNLLDSVEVAGSLEAAIAAEEASSGHLTADAERHQAEIDGSVGLLARRDVLASAKARFDRIAHDLTDSRFVRFLLDDERGRLAELGSDHFMRLSSGRYRFTEDGTFDIVDLTAADAVRKAASLSGGETFLASLALALALAEMVTRTGGRLDAFFLDEGFGSLDPEHLDLAMEGIEALAAEDVNRLVVVVSHVPEMRQRIEDLIELDRHTLTGDTKVIRA